MLIACSEHDPILQADLYKQIKQILAGRCSYQQSRWNNANSVAEARAVCQIMRRKAAIKKKKLNVVKGGLATSVSFGYNQVASLAMPESKG